MCTSYTLRLSTKEVIVRFNVDTAIGELPIRDCNAPTQMIAVVTENSPRSLELMKWGLVPSWAKDPAIGKRMLNARAETLAEKPAFKSALSKRRCLIPADGFYEWHTVGKRKYRYRIQLKNEQLFAFAGLWEEWKDMDGEPLHSCTIITCVPNPLIAKIHDRMPAILRPQDEALWLSPGSTLAKDVTPLLHPYSESEMTAYPDEKQGDKIASVQTNLLFV